MSSPSFSSKPFSAIPEFMSIGDPISDTEQAHIMSIVYKLVGLPSNSTVFPACYPTPLMSNHIPTLIQNDYFVCERAIGLRLLLLLLNAPASQPHSEHSGVGFIINNANRVRRVDIRAPDSDGKSHHETLIDGCLTIDHLSNGSDSLHFLSLDIMALHGNPSISTRPLDKRLGKLDTQVVRPYRSFHHLKHHPSSTDLQSPTAPSASPRPPFDMTLQSMQRAYGLSLILDRNIPHCRHVCDGVLFLPVNAPYRPGPCSESFQWVPPRNILLLVNTVQPGEFMEDEVDHSITMLATELTFKLLARVSDSDNGPLRSVGHLSSMDPTMAEGTCNPPVKRVAEVSWDLNNAALPHSPTTTIPKTGVWRWIRWVSDSSCVSTLAEVRQFQECRTDCVSEGQMRQHMDPIRTAWKLREADSLSHRNSQDTILSPSATKDSFANDRRLSGAHHPSLTVPLLAHDIRGRSYSSVPSQSVPSSMVSSPHVVHSPALLGRDLAHRQLYHTDEHRSGLPPRPHVGPPPLRPRSFHSTPLTASVLIDDPPPWHVSSRLDYVRPQLPHRPSSFPALLPTEFKHDKWDSSPACNKPLVDHSSAPWKDGKKSNDFDSTSTVADQICSLRGTLSDTLGTRELPSSFSLDVPPNLSMLDVKPNNLGSTSNSVHTAKIKPTLISDASSSNKSSPTSSQAQVSLHDQKFIVGTSLVPPTTLESAESDHYSSATPPASHVLITDIVGVEKEELYGLMNNESNLASLTVLGNSHAKTIPVATKEIPLLLPSHPVVKSDPFIKSQPTHVAYPVCSSPAHAMSTFQYIADPAATTSNPLKLNVDTNIAGFVNHGSLPNSARMFHEHTKSTSVVPLKLSIQSATEGHNSQSPIDPTIDFGPSNSQQHALSKSMQSALSLPKPNNNGTTSPVSITSNSHLPSPMVVDSPSRSKLGRLLGGSLVSETMSPIPMPFVPVVMSEPLIDYQYHVQERRLTGPMDLPTLESAFQNDHLSHKVPSRVNEERDGVCMVLTPIGQKEYPSPRLGGLQAQASGSSLTGLKSDLLANPVLGTYSPIKNLTNAPPSKPLKTILKKSRMSLSFLMNDNMALNPIQGPVGKMHASDPSEIASLGDSSAHQQHEMTDADVALLLTEMQAPPLEVGSDTSQPPMPSLPAAEPTGPSASRRFVTADHHHHLSSNFYHPYKDTASRHANVADHPYSSSSFLSPNHFGKGCTPSHCWEALAKQQQGQHPTYLPNLPQHHGYDALNKTPYPVQSHYHPLSSHPPQSKPLVVSPHITLQLYPNGCPSNYLQHPYQYSSMHAAVPPHHASTALASPTQPPHLYSARTNAQQQHSQVHPDRWPSFPGPRLDAPPK